MSSSAVASAAAGRSWPQPLPLLLVLLMTFSIVRRTSAEEGFSGGEKNLAPDVRNNLKVYRDVLLRWIREVEFATEYRSQMVLYPTLVALEGGQEPVRIPGAPTARGRLAKAGDKVRLEVKYDGGPREVGVVPGKEGKPDQVLQQFLPTTAIINGDFELAYHPAVKIDAARGRASGDTVSIFRRSPEDRGGLAAGRSDVLETTPIAPRTRNISTLLDLRLATPNGIITAQKVEFLAPDKTHRGFEFTFARDGVKLLRRVMFWTEPEVPVLSSIEIVDLAALPELRKFVIQFSDFKECRGGLVPARVTSFFVDRSRDRNPQGPFPGWEWIGENLGESQPTDNDFSLRLPQTARVTGMRRLPEVVDGHRVFDIDEIREQDLLKPGETVR